MPLVALPDGRRVRFPEGMSAEAMQSEVERAFPQFAAPKESLADFMAQPPAALTETSPLTQTPSSPAAETIAALPKSEFDFIAQQAPNEPPAVIGASEAAIPRFGEPGTITRGVSDVVSGLMEWALNRPEEALATLTPLAPAIALRYGPPVAIQFGKDVAAGARGDREAMGRALAMTALVGVPAAAGKAIKAAEAKGLVEGEPGVLLPSVDVEARAALAPASAQVRVSPVPLTEQALVDTKSTLTRVPEAESAAATISEKGVQSAIGLGETEKAVRDVLRTDEAGQAAIGELPKGVDEGGERVRAQAAKAEAAKAVEETAAKSEVAPRAEAAPAEEPLGFFRPSRQDPSLRVMTEDEFASHLSSVTKQLEATEALYDTREFTAVEKTAMGQLQDKYEAAQLEKYRRGFAKQANEEVFHELLNLTDNIDPNAPKLAGNPDFQRLTILKDILEKRTGQEGELAGEWFKRFLGGSADAREVYAGRYQKVRELFSRINQEAPSSEALPPPTTEPAPSRDLPPSPPPESEVNTPGGTGVREAVPALPEAPPGEPPAAALIAETAPVPQLIGISNARVDMQRADRGLEPIMAAERKADPVLWDQAMAALEREPGMADRVTRELLERPRPISDVESIVLTRRLVELTNDLDQARWEGIKARDAEQALEERLRRERLAPEEQQAMRVQMAEERARIADAEARAGVASDALSAVEQASGKGFGGTETGRALRARRLLMREDFSPAGLERQRRAAKDFESLSSEELANLRKTASEFSAINTALEERIRVLTEETAKADARRALAEAKAEEAKTKAAMGARVKAIVTKVGEALDRRADAARERLRGKVFTLSPDVLADLAEIGASNLYHIGADLARWSAKMVEELGERVRPHLEELWQKSQRLLEERLNEAAATRSGKRAAKSAPADIETAREALKGRLRKRIADYEEKIRTGAFERPKRGALPPDKEIQRLEYELEQIKKRFHEGLVELKMSRRTRVQRVFGATAESVNAMRAVLTSADLSAVLRQGKFVVAAHPVRGAKSIPAMLRAFASDRAAFEVEREIAARDNYPLYRASGLYLAEHGALLSKMEEAYMSRWATQLPGVGRLVKASERAYTTFLNKLRADSFDAMKAALGRGGEVTMPEARILSNFINVATGRGTALFGEKAATGLNTWFFAPRYVASRFQMLMGQPLLYGIQSGKAGFAEGMRARKLVAAEYGRIVLGMSAYYALGLMAGATIETDPRSTDFLKLKWGNTRIDPTAGLAQITVLLTRLIGGETKTAKGKVQPIRGPKVPYGGETTLDVLARFGRFKLAPAPGLALNLATQTTALGDPLTPEDVVLQTVVPISFGDIWKSIEEQGVEGGLPLAVLSIFGEGVQNYDANKRRARFP